MIFGENNNKYKHGMAGTRINTIWRNMRARCNNPNKESNRSGKRIIVVYGG